MINRLKQAIPYTVAFNIKRFLRKANFSQNTPYEKIKTVKNKHKGERCFIVATGPSLTMSDLEKLKNETTISMNSIILAFDETDWRPTYYGIQDGDVYRKLENQIKNVRAEGIFIADWLVNNIQISNSDHLFVFPLNFLNHVSEHNRYHTKFSNDAYAVVYDGYTITYSLIQIAVYMGFKEIYLLGVDCSYPNNLNHYFKNYGHVDPTYSLARDKMMSAYKVAKKYADQHKIKIFNATRGGMLEVFERVDLDKVLTESKHFVN